MSKSGSKGSGFAFRLRTELGLEGPEAQELWEHGCIGVAEEGEEIVGYFDSVVALPLEGVWHETLEHDYLERYYRELDCLTVGSLVIAPTHRTAVLSAGQKPLWIDPGMAFGTGHHETTRLALEALTAEQLMGKRVLDVGAGSGILAIAADLLGAGRSLGVDIDDQTIPIARENAELNRSRAVFERRGLNADDRADLIVANLHAELHVELASAYAAALRPGGSLLVTGILAERASLVEEALADSFESAGWQADGEWRLLAAVRKRDSG
ncbi:MAG: 50S ribosomal protein L11 methyltransferase [Trueperaceae bacterium]